MRRVVHQSHLESRVRAHSYRPIRSRSRARFGVEGEQDDAPFAVYLLFRNEARPTAVQVPVRDLRGSSARDLWPSGPAA